MKEPNNILITGATSGIGRALALEYAATGKKLFLIGRNQQRLEQIKEECEKKDADVFVFSIDIRDAEKLADWIIKRDEENNIDLVIANAGISGGTGKFQDSGGGESEQQVREIFAINVTGVLNTILPIIPKMKSRKKGQIAIMSSLASFRALPGAPSYSASKAAVRCFGEALRGDLQQYGVEVSVICPGYVRTPMTDVNNFPMPFVVEPEKAAIIIKSGLSRNAARIAFPFLIYIFIWFVGCLPTWLTDPIFSRLPKKE